MSVQVVKYEVKAVFSKQGRARFISHLDMMRCMQRSFRRSKVPIWYTMGYNPHAYLMFPLPLSLGMSSSCEIMYFAVNEEPDYEKIKAMLNPAMPSGIEIVSLSAPGMKHTEITAADYKAVISGGIDESFTAKFNDFLNQNEIFIEKFSKKNGMVKTDIKSDIISGTSCFADNKLLVEMRLSAGCLHNLNMPVVIKAFEDYCGTEFETVCIERTKIVADDGKDFI